MPLRPRPLSAMWPLRIAALLFSITLGLIGGQPALMPWPSPDDADTLVLPRRGVALHCRAARVRPARHHLHAYHHSRGRVALHVYRPGEATCAGLQPEPAPGRMTIDADLRPHPVDAGGDGQLHRRRARRPTASARTHSRPTPSRSPDGSQLPERIWDPRLDQRGPRSSRQALRPAKATGGWSRRAGSTRRRQMRAAPTTTSSWTYSTIQERVVGLPG